MPDRHVRFSQRHGYTPVKDVVQRESMDADLRVGLWNVLDLGCWQPWGEIRVRAVPALRQFANDLWHDHFKWPTDTVPEWSSDVAGRVRDHFFSCYWHQVLDLVEFVVQRHPNPRVRPALATGFNAVLQREVSAYRIVGGRVVEITSSEEIAAIEEALAETQSLGGVGTHLRTALDMLADRESPDYRNSIKESISAVEATVNQIEGKRGTLGEALKRLGVDAHPALRGAFTRLYGYTSDAGGIRHAMMEESGLEFEDAKFMLVSCSAFVNYLRAKAARADVAM